MVNPRIIDIAQGMLRDLSGLVPTKDRQQSNEYVKALERVLLAYGAAITTLNDLQAHMGRLDRATESTITAIES